MKALVLALFWLASTGAWSASIGVYEKAVSAPLEPTYKAVYEALEEARFWVVYEIDMGANLARFAEKWGDDYNRSGLEGIRVMVVCNGWQANRVANADPALLAFCPLRVTLIHRDGETRVLFARPTRIAGESPAAPVLEEVEQTIIRAIDAGAAAAAQRPREAAP
jgi:uncharacterized protein (DUF302 family)